MGEEVGVLELLEIERKRIIPARFYVSLFTQLLPVSRYVFGWGLVAYLDIRVVVEVCEVGYLIPLAIVVVPDLRQVVLREDVVLVDCVLLSACSDGEVLGKRRRAEQRGRAQDDERGNVAEP